MSNKKSTVVEMINHGTSTTALMGIALGMAFDPGLIVVGVAGTIGAQIILKSSEAIASHFKKPLPSEIPHADDVWEGAEAGILHDWTYRHSLNKKYRTVLQSWIKRADAEGHADIARDFTEILGRASGENEKYYMGYHGKLDGRKADILMLDKGNGVGGKWFVSITIFDDNDNAGHHNEDFPTHREAFEYFIGATMKVITAGQEPHN